jgi:murein DD-endopeptidase MepM/ murein hydrolase activator NlpD
MERPRTTAPRTTALISVLGMAVLATPAFAAVPAEQVALAAQTVIPVENQNAAKERAAKRRAAQKRAAERKERREPQGPFHPLDGTPDYGTAENAFGAARSGHVHEGHDVFAPTGTPLVAVTDGVVAEAGSDGGQGNYLYLYDPKGDRTFVYMHMIAPAKVSTGQDVKAGQPVGGLGCTGSCWGEHLHFEVHAGKGIEGEAQDPLPLLERWERVD